MDSLETIVGDNHVNRWVNKVSDVVLSAAIALDTAADRSGGGQGGRPHARIQRQFAASSGELEVEFPIIVPPPETLTSKVIRPFPVFLLLEKVLFTALVEYRLHHIGGYPYTYSKYD